MWTRKRYLSPLLAGILVLSTALIAPLARADGDGPGGLELGTGGLGQKYNGTQTWIVPGNDGSAHTQLTGRPGCGGCYWEFVVACMFNDSPTDDALCLGAVQPCAGAGILYRAYFYDAPGAGRQARGTVCRGGPGGAVTLADLQAALPAFTQDSMGVPDPRFEVQPSDGALVNFPMIVHASSPGPVTKDFFAVLGAFTVRVTATPASYDWSFSDGGRMTTTDGGRGYDGTSAESPGPYPSGYYVSHVFSRTGTASASLAMGWTGTATIAGLPPFTLPALNIPAVTRGVQVREARSRLVAG